VVCGVGPVLPSDRGGRAGSRVRAGLPVAPAGSWRVHPLSPAISAKSCAPGRALAIRSDAGSLVSERILILWIKRKRGRNPSRSGRLPVAGASIASRPVRAADGGPAWQRLPTAPLPVVGQPVPVPAAAPDLVRGHVRGHLCGDLRDGAGGYRYGCMPAGESGGRHRATL
jgi:hypothetical protein